MANELCHECFEPMMVIERTTGEKSLYCNLCGCCKESQDHGNDSLLVAEDESSAFCFSGQGAKPQGYKYEKYRASAAQKKAKECLDLLCQQFSIPTKFKQGMEALMEQAKVQRKQKAIVGGIFLAYLRDQQEQDSTTEKPTLRQVSNVLEIPMSKIAAAIKQLQTLLRANNYNTGSGAITNIDSLVKTVLPTVILYDPLVPDVDVTDRVLSLTGKIIALMQRRSTHSIEPNLITIAAHFLAWQSCFFYQKAHHSQVSMHSLRKPGSLPTLEKHLELLKLDRSMLVAVQRHYTQLLKEFTELLKKMPWVVEKKRIASKQRVAEHLETILEFQEVVCDVLSEEAEIKRSSQVHIQPPIPRELTAEEEAALETPELSEKDLPDSELKKYLRSSEEIESLKQLVESEPSDPEN